MSRPQSQARITWLWGDCKIAGVENQASANGVITGRTLSFSNFLFASAVFDGTPFGLAHCVIDLLFVDSKFGLHSRFFVKDLPNRGGFVPAMFLIGECLEGSVEDQRKSDRDGRGLLVSHAADGVIANMTRQENSLLTECMIQSYTSLHAQNEAAKGQCAGDVPPPATGSRNSARESAAGQAESV